MLFGLARQSVIIFLPQHTALLKASGDILENLATRTGWSRDDVDKTYRETIRYRAPIPDDLDGDTWMDIVNRKGKPWIRNIGLLR